jgi:hypothetical protein
MENNFEKQEKLEPMSLEEYEERIKRLENGEIISEALQEGSDTGMDDEELLSVFFGNSLFQYKPTKEEKNKFEDLCGRAEKITDKFNKEKQES